LAKFVIRRALFRDVPRLQALLLEWQSWKPKTGRSRSIRRAIKRKEFLVAEAGSEVLGFIHFIIHEDVIDGAPNSFITAFYVQKGFRGRGIGTRLLHDAIVESVAHGAVSVETSTIHSSAKTFYEKRHFKQTIGEIGEVFLELDLKKSSEAQ
jgi:GNAT superfamily N-acetyltransferase